ncbi:MarR family winged helix-turn-helix transcriptional regulator [Nocardiopsis kunsanensis]|uniref:MarR family transcriptional regulator n=1 Tax=Nocardiopsis kunsanensis TaxID=141693 RepID=A0A918XCN7_9ACTN|nr:MarR family winged helix-turn-helix transcriptional regulator [Nocardiopsis kunsanensis]GHD24515.1 MarR family transcriptional regulator [Nocardiopsis kunsanensis]
MSDTRWLDEGEQWTWRNFLTASHLLEAQLDRQLRRDSGISHSAYSTLAALSEAPERAMTMSALAAYLRASQSRMSHSVSGLEREGLVRRFKRRGDRRTTVVEITDHGFGVLGAAAPGHVEEVRRVLFDALTPEQVSQLDGISAALLDALDPEETEPRYTR